MLARALSHDLRMESMRDLWLDNADVTVLLSPDTKAGAWSKWFLKPFLWGAAKTGMLGAITRPRGAPEALAARALALVPAAARRPHHGRPDVRRGHLDGRAASTRRSRCCRRVTILDLFVTLTDFYGYHQLVQIHDPPLIHELDHNHVLQFTYRRRSDGTVESDFDMDNAPALAFAARATSSFPGAFPPARIVEMDEAVAQRHGTWPRREEFIARSFEHHLRADVDPAVTPFIDGAVLNNRPFQLAISAIHGRPAYRQVDRRLVYIEPHPAPPVMPSRQRMPRLLRDAARRDVGHPELAAGDQRAQLGQSSSTTASAACKAINDSARPQVSRLVAGVLPETLDRAITAQELRDWREQVNSQVARDAGFAYQAYVRLEARLGARLRRRS